MEAFAVGGTSSSLLDPSQSQHARLDSPEKRALARERIHEATVTIPIERKSAYLEARDKAPYLFENESDPYRFLLTCDFNIWEAAQRMTVYWEERKKLFGPYRAFLPMTVTGDGALTREDIQSLQGGFPSFLPDTASGQKIAYFDRRQWLATATPEQRLRSIFYMNRVLSDDERTLQEGTLILILLVAPRTPEVDFDFVKRATYLACNALPVKVAHCHLLNCPPKHPVRTKKQYMIQDVIVSYVGCFVQKGFSMADDMDVHFEREPGDIFNFLHDELGLAPEGIPHEFGGTWDFTNAISWCRKKALEERETFKLTLQAAKRARPPKAFRDEKREVVDTVSKRRANNAMHSKRKRERRRQEMLNITVEHKKLMQENLGLKAEQVRLEECLQKANQIFSYLATPAFASPTPAFTMSMNCQGVLENCGTVEDHAPVFSPHAQRSFTRRFFNPCQSSAHFPYYHDMPLETQHQNSVHSLLRQHDFGINLKSACQVSGEHPCQDPISPDGRVYRQQINASFAGVPGFQAPPSIAHIAAVTKQHPEEEQQELIRLLLQKDNDSNQHFQQCCPGGF